MGARIATTVFALALVGSLAGCGPGPSGYAEWSSYREQRANRHAYLARRNAEAAQWQAQMGDYRGAQLSQSAADNETSQAQQEQAHAARDRWLSRF